MTDRPQGQAECLDEKKSYEHMTKKSQNMHEFPVNESVNENCSVTRF